ncbi:MAG: guanylate kinase [Chitinophagales bacterium]|nr:guanylate kinase [Chitinophagales bacterium]
MKHPKVIVFTSPSGAGKTTIVRHLLSYYEKLAFSISATTRKQREGEINGVHYFFLSEAEFLHRLKENEFLEWEEVYEGIYYGTLRTEIDRLHKLGKIVVLDIDVKGALNIKKDYGKNALCVFVKPPSFEILIERLKNRGTEDDEELQKRIERMEFELKHEYEFDAVIVNDVLSNALTEAEKVVEAFINHPD